MTKKERQMMAGWDRWRDQARRLHRKMQRQKYAIIWLTEERDLLRTELQEIRGVVDV